MPESGSLEAASSSAGPVMKPLYSTRPTADVLIEAAGKLKSPVALPWKSYDEAIKAGFDRISLRRLVLIRRIQHAGVNTG